MQDRDLPAIKPLTARSVVLSTLLGYHPPAMPVSGLVRVGALFGIAERTTRVALTRLAADGDVVADNGVYRLTERLLRRQAQQDEASSPRLKGWTGAWEMAIITAPARPLADRVALRKSMAGFRLAELREGVWIRPDNLLRPLDGPIAGQCALFEGRYPDPAMLAGSLWDLPAWSAEARRLRAELDGASSLTGGFMVIAEVVRHLRSDPCLPPELLPGQWPALELRDRFTEFRSAYAHRLRKYSQALRVSLSTRAANTLCYEPTSPGNPRSGTRRPDYLADRSRLRREEAGNEALHRHYWRCSCCAAPSPSMTSQTDTVAFRGVGQRSAVHPIRHRQQQQQPRQPRAAWQWERPAVERIHALLSRRSVLRGHRSAGRLR